MVETLWDKITQFVSPEAGQARSRALNEAIGYYIPPEMRGLLGLVADASPSASYGRAAQASQEMVAPGRTPMQRIGSAGEMLSSTAEIAAPMAVAGRAGMPVAQAVQEGLLGFSAGADDAARRFVADESGAIRAFHGSPHDFDRFSMDKIGTGEGAQVYGHGLYFAEAEPVAKMYRDQLSQGNTSAARRTLESAGGDVNRAISETESKLRRLDERASAGDFGGDERRFNAQRQIQVDKINQLTNFRDTGEFNAGRMYEVNINASPEDFLDWDRPLSEQSNVLRRLGLSTRTEQEINDEALRLMEQGNAKAGRAGGWMDDPQIAARIEVLNDEIMNSAPDVTGESFYRSGGQGGAADLMSQMGGGSPQLRAQELRDAGIPGIRYFDQGSRTAGEGSRNFVVFDENLINIVRKYGIAGAAAMLGVSAMDVEQAMAQGSQPQPQGLLSGVQ